MRPKLLLVGGTQFVGRNVLEFLAQEGDYDITIFNRGFTNNDLAKKIGVQTILGDRSSKDIEKIARENWDFVIDTSCYFPKDLELALSQLRGRVKKYILISTCSVYDSAMDTRPHKDETFDILNCTLEQSVNEKPETYGNRKAECERVLINSGLNYCILRPALVYGRYDFTDRFYFWLHKVKTMDVLMLPEKGQRLFSITYIDDLVNAIGELLRSTLEGVYNVISQQQTSIAEIVELIEEISDKKIDTQSASVPFLKQKSMKEWIDFPLWLSKDHFRFSNEKLLRDLSFSRAPFRQSILETIDYYRTINWPEPKIGISNIEMLELINKNEIA